MFHGGGGKACQGTVLLGSLFLALSLSVSVHPSPGSGPDDYPGPPTGFLPRPGLLPGRELAWVAPAGLALLFQKIICGEMTEH